jgi:hypothetical protein
MKNPRLSICENGYRFNYNENEEIKWVFLSKYRSNNIPVEIKKEITR